MRRSKAGIVLIAAGCLGWLSASFLAAKNEMLLISVIDAVLALYFVIVLVLEWRE